MAWEENPRICLHMQLIAILSRTGVFSLSPVSKPTEVLATTVRNRSCRGLGVVRRAVRANSHLLISKFDTLSPDGIGRLRVGDSH